MNELEIKKDDLLTVVEDKSLGELIKPLVNEIHLFDTVIAGTTYIDDETVYETLGNGEKLILQRENNKFDSKAILILNQDKKKLGYVPERDNMVFSRLMDAGKLLIAKVISVRNTDGFYRVSIGIYLVDY
ncbi:MAG: HIRAN domain-containing protein [Solobacterium sp.]|nr:HIRAN domain-containing protein [Solobacterium sp.]